MDTERVAVTDVGSLGFVGNIFVNVWRTTPSAEMSRLRRPWVERVAKQYTTMGMLTVLVSDQVHRLPDAAYRAETKHQISWMSHLDIYVATVVQMQSLMASVVRTYIRGQNRLSRGNARYQSFDSVEAASRWLPSAVGTEAPSDAELLALVRKLTDLPRSSDR